MSNKRHYYDSFDEEDFEEDDDDEMNSKEDDESSFDIYADEEPRGSDGDEDTDYDHDEETPTPPPPPPPLPTKQLKKTVGGETSTSSEKRRGTNRISALPDSLILRILSLLPTKDAVRTGTLSKRWLYLWTSVENISFIYRYSPPVPTLDDKRVNKFISFVDKTLVLCTSSNIKKFRIDFDYERRFAPNVNLWVRFAMQKNVEEFELDFYSRSPGNRYKLPQYVYANSCLTKLNLAKCKINPFKVVSWKLLRVLTLKCAELLEHVVRKILSGSPALEYLELYRCWVFDNKLHFNSESLRKLVIRGYRNPLFEEEDFMLEISAPNVLSMEITGYFIYKKFRLGNVSSLVDVKLDFDRTCDSKDDYIEERDMFTDLLVSLHHVKELTMGSWCIQVLSILEVKGLPSPLSKRKCLTLLTHTKKWDLPGIASLLQSSPELETLVINMASPRYVELHFGSDFLDSYNFDGENYWTSQKRDLKCLLLDLRIVKIVGFMGGSCEYKAPLVQFLLENAPVLEKMVISAGSVGCEGDSMSDISPEFLQVTEKLLSNPRSSPHVVITFPGISIT